MNKLKLVFFLLFFVLSKISIASFYITNDSLPSSCKKISVSSSIAAIGVGSQIGLYQLWYAPYNSGKFHVFNDWNQWRKMDKIGHAYSAYELASSTYELFKWSGFTTNKSILIAGSVSWVYQGLIEVMDGYSEGWGFSIPDLLFNSLGTGIFVVNKKFGSSLLLPKFSYSPSPYAELRPEVLGSSTAEKVLKDYNAQTYWLGINPSVFIPKWRVKWLVLSVGYSINEHLIGNQLGVQINGTNYNSYGQLFFSMDIDPRELPIRNKLLKKLLYPLNFIKFPFPTFSIEKGKAKFYPIYF